MKPEIENILDFIQKELGVTRYQLMASTRSSRDIAHARQVAVYMCYSNIPDISWSELGRVFGRDRTTMRHAYRKICELCDKDKDFDNRLEVLQRVFTTTAF
jgi:chromosomal replication initiator protein